MTRTAYPSDLSDAQWEKIERHLPPPKQRGRPYKHDRREIFNAILYLDRSGCAWRMLPHDLPPYRSVFYWFRQWQRDGTFERLHTALHLQLRVALGREPEPTVALLDSQSVKSTEKGGPKAPLAMMGGRR